MFSALLSDTLAPWLYGVPLSSASLDRRRITIRFPLVAIVVNNFRKFPRPLLEPQPQLFPKNPSLSLGHGPLLYLLFGHGTKAINAIKPPYPKTWTMHIHTESWVALEGEIVSWSSNFSG